MATLRSIKTTLIIMAIAVVGYQAVIGIFRRTSKSAPTRSGSNRQLNSAHKRILAKTNPKKYYPSLIKPRLFPDLVERAHYHYISHDYNGYIYVIMIRDVGDLVDAAREFFCSSRLVSESAPNQHVIVITNDELRVRQKLSPYLENRKHTVLRNDPVYYNITQQQVTDIDWSSRIIASELRAEFTERGVGFIYMEANQLWIFQPHDMCVRRASLSDFVWPGLNQSKSTGTTLPMTINAYKPTLRLIRLLAEETKLQKDLNEYEVVEKACQDLRVSEKMICATYDANTEIQSFRHFYNQHKNQQGFVHPYPSIVAGLESYQSFENIDDDVIRELNLHKQLVPQCTLKMLKLLKRRR